MEITVVIIVGILASFFGSFTSAGTSVVAFTLLSLYGLPVFTILGIYKIGAVGFQLGGLYNYIKAEKVIWKLVLPLVVVGSIGAYIGGSIILSLDQELLEKIIGFAILLFVPLSLLKPELGVKNVMVGKPKQAVGYVVYFLTSLWGSSFVIGAGIVTLISQMYFFGLTLLEVKGTSKIPSLIKNLIVFGLFWQAGLVNWSLGLSLLGGMFIGSFLGTKLAIKVGDQWLKNLLFVTIIVLALKLIFG